MHSSISPQVSRGFSLGPHTPTPKPGFSSWATLFVCAASILMIIPPAHAQSAPCGLTSIRETKPLNYPPIWKIAHVQGTVVLLATFDRKGNVTQVKPVSGPDMFKGAVVALSKAAIEFVQGWKANSFSGPRECPIAIDFVIGRETENPTTTITRIDLQHVKIVSELYPPTVQYSASSTR
jgi:hypothetical protein